MGQTLSSPATEKVSESGSNDRFAYAVSQMQGWRISMEDAHAVALSLEEDGPNSFFAVYDGHGGSTVAKFAGDNVHKRLVQEETYRQKQYETALRKAFLGTDEDLLADPAHISDPSGCTAVAALLTEDQIYVANAGDSRSILSVAGTVKPLSFDHKPCDDTEKARIAGAGGFVEYGRVNGNLALSRALGDFVFKKNYNLIPEDQIITSNPDVTIHDIAAEDEFLVLACDGIWDCLTSQDVVDFVRRKVWEGKELTEIGEMICEHCLAPDTASSGGIGCDNMTILIIAFLHGRTKEGWYEWIRDRVERNYGYNTPSDPPQIYSQARLTSFRARREAQAERDRLRREDPQRQDNFGPTFIGDSSPFTGFARVLGGNGGITFRPGSGFFSKPGALMFGGDDSDDDDSLDDDMDVDGVESGRSVFGYALGVGGSREYDPTRSLREKLQRFELEFADEEGEGDRAIYEGGPMGEGSSHFSAHFDLDESEQQETSHSPGSPHSPGSRTPTSPLPNGDWKIPIRQEKPTIDDEERQASPAMTHEVSPEPTENP